MSDLVEERDDEEENEEEIGEKVFKDAEEEVVVLESTMVDIAWLKTLRKIVMERYEPTEPFLNSGVQIACERMMIAAYERMSRIMRNDLPTDEI